MIIGIIISIIINIFDYIERHKKIGYEFNRYLGFVMHPIIKDFIEKHQPLSEVLELNCDKTNYLETVFLKICKLKNVVFGFDPQTYDEIDQATLQGHPDANVYLLFIGLAIDFTCRRKHTEKSNVLLSIGSSLSTDKIHPTVLAIYYLSIGTFRFYEGKYDEGRVFLRKALSMVKKNQPKYLPILLGYASLISQEGRLNDLEKDELELIYTTNNEQHKFLCVDIKLSNLILTGNYKKGLGFFDEFKQLFPSDATFIVEGKNNLLKILSGDFDEKNYREEKLKLYANICKNLSSGNMLEAQRYYQIMENKKWVNVAFIPFEKYLPLHIELSLKNKGKARLLFQELSQAGETSYMDDFFLARLQLLENNVHDAQETFKKLMENVSRYDAMNRLAFELQFAKELSGTDVLFFMSGVNKEQGIKDNSPAIDISLKPKKLFKGVKQIIGESHAITQVKKLIKQFAIIEEPVLIMGETGTGKELVSRAIHEEGKFSNEPFLAINCGALTDSLLQSELFGYVAGAFTGAQKERLGIFEAAGKGTVFLDEFGDISPKMQMSLLRVLESKEIRLIGGTATRQINCKIVIASNIDLVQAVSEKKFREDLYYRLTRYDIKLPPLRVRSEDIPMLIKFFMEDKLLAKPLLDALTRYSWPGNIRELKNEIERLKIIHSDKKLIEMEDFDFTRLQGFTDSVANLKVDEQLISAPNSKTSIKNKEVNEDEILKIVQRGSKVEQRHEFIKSLFLKYKKLTRSQIMEIAKISPVTATKDMETLCQSGFIERRTPTKSVKSHFFVLVE